MNKIIYVLLTLVLSNAMAAPEGKCSVENLEKLLNLSAKIIGDLGQASMDYSKLISSKQIDTMPAKEIKTHFRKIQDEQHLKTTSSFDQISSIVNAFPECDKNYNFRLKNK